jgi:hypothetical protein
MTRIKAEILTSLKTLNITYQTPLETLLDTPETLPTTEPATPQIKYTLASGDFPTLSIDVYSKIWVDTVFAAGKFVTAGTLYWRLKKNGVSLSTGSGSVGSGTFYTLNSGFYDVKVGDVLEIALWSSVSDSNWDYKAHQVLVTRVLPFRNIPQLSPCNFTGVTTQSLTLGNPSVQGYYAYIPYHDDVSLGWTYTTKNFRGLYCGPTYGTFRIRKGDESYPNAAVLTASSTYRPYYHSNYIVTQMVFRGLKV